VSAAYDHGREAGRLNLAPSLNPHPDHSCAFVEWHQGWIRERGERLREISPRGALRPGPQSPAQILPHPSLTGAQVELLCRREGLVLGRLDRDRFVLIPTANRPGPMLRIARPDPEAA